MVSPVILALLCVAQFVVVLDATIVAVALPAMQADLGLSTTALGWVITAYTLTFGGCLLAAGRLADRRRAPPRLRRRPGAVRARLAGLRACSERRRVARGARDARASARRSWRPPRSRCSRRRGPRAEPEPARWDGGPRPPPAAERAVGSSVALLSGLLDWRWVFLVNVPVCALGAVAALLVLPEQRVPSPARADLAGAALATTALAALVSH